MTSIVPGWVKAIIGLAVAGIILYTLPIMDLLAMFMYFCVIPAVFVACLALGVFGLYEWGWNAFHGTWNTTLDSLKDRVVVAATEMKARQQV